MRTILAVLACVALLQIAFYLTGTASMLAILSPQAATRLSGLPDALILGLKTLGFGALGPAVLVGGFLCLLGSYSAWFGVAARLPFAAGIDAVLPPAFGRRDPKSGAPVVSIAVQTAVVAVIVILSQAGDTLKGAYDFLVAMSVLSYTLPFLFLFAVFLWLQVRAPRSGDAPADAWRTPGGPHVALAIGAVGMTATIVAVLCTLVPSPDAKNQLWEAAKLVFASAVLIFSGVAAYALAKRRGARSKLIDRPPMPKSDTR
jgi:amino acid transporter